MLITILTTGTRGDTQPYIALGLALKKTGHTVRIAAFENYENFVKGYGLEYYPIRGDVSKAAASLIGKKSMRADNPLMVILSFNKLKTLVYDLQQDFFEACKGADAVVYHPGAAIGYYAAQSLNIPSILATPFPMTPTRAFPGLLFYGKVHLGRSVNLITHRIFEQIMWSASSGVVKKFWKNTFGHLPEKFGNPFRRQNTGENPTLISCSKFVFPRPDDWSGHVHMDGYWFLEEEDGWSPSKELQEFLLKGAPPVYVGFGSIGDPELANQTTEIVLEALKLSGQRGILATGWNGLSIPGDLPENIFVLESAPHSWLFPRMAAVVHHGGAGTTAAGLKAGVPSIIIPFSNDQFAWAQRVYELGVGAKPIPRKNLTAAKLADAIRFVLSEEIIANAKEMGRKIQSELGADAAARVIIECLEPRKKS